MGRHENLEVFEQLENGVICRLLHPHIRYVGWEDSKAGLSRNYRPEYLHVASPCRSGFLTAWWLVQKVSILKESIKKLNFSREPDRSSMAFSDLDLEVSQHHFCHILSDRSESQRPARCKKRTFRPHCLVVEWQCHIEEKHVGWVVLLHPYQQIEMCISTSRLFIKRSHMHLSFWSLYQLDILLPAAKESSLIKLFTPTLMKVTILSALYI